MFCTQNSSQMQMQTEGGLLFRGPLCIFPISLQLPKRLYSLVVQKIFILRLSSIFETWAFLRKFTKFDFGFTTNKLGAQIEKLCKGCRV